MTDEERIVKLEKKVKTLEIVGVVRFAIVALTLLGITSVIMDKLKKSGS